MHPRAISRLMHSNYGIRYCNNVIGRLKGKFQKELYGDANDGLRNLHIKMKEIKEQGGNYEMYHDEQLVISGIAYQTEDMLKMQECYNDYVIHDGTFGTNMHGMTLMPTVVVDCLGKSVISSVMVGHSENSDDLIKMSTDLKLFNGGETYMTDGGSCYPIVAEHFGLNHVLCVHHFHKGLEQNSKLNMSALNRISFKNGCTNVINLEYETEYKAQMDLLQATHMDNEVAMAYLHSIDAQKHKVCRAYIGKYFKAGGSSSQRAESVNSKIKERGTLSSELKKHNIFQLACHINGSFEQDKCHSMKQIESLLKQDAKWSAWVNERWQKESLLSSKYLAFPDQGSTYIVRYKKDPSISRLVNIPVDSSPSCSCTYFTSNLIPCRHIACAIHSTKDVEEFQVSHLASRWHLKNHPFYIEAGISAGIFKAKNKAKTILKDDDDELERDIGLYQNIQVPTQTNVRYNNLFHLFKQLSEYSSNKHTYRVIYGQLIQLLNTVKQGSNNAADSTTGSNNDMLSLLPPPVVTSRTSTTTSSVNHVSVKKRTGGILSQGGSRKCRKCGLHGHRADNSSCPMFTKVSDVNEKRTTLDDIVHQEIADEKENKID
jgi:hypothetical protein